MSTNSSHNSSKERMELMDAVTIKVQDKDFVVKRSLLSDNSSYFHELLPPIEPGTISKKKKMPVTSLELHGVSKAAFKWLIKFMFDERLDVGKCFEDDDLKDVGEIVDAARLIRYGNLLKACATFADNWHANGNLTASYAMAKKLGMVEPVEEMRLLVFKLLLPDNPDSESEIQQNGVYKLEDVPFILLVDSLSAFEDEDRRRAVISFKEERSSGFLLSRLKKVLKWLVARREEVPTNAAQKLLSRLLLEEIPLPRIEEAVRGILIHKNKYPSLVRAVETELNRIKRDIASKISELVVIESKGLLENESKISKYACGDREERWKEIFFKADFELMDAAIVGEILYLFGIRAVSTHRVNTSEKIGYAKYPNESFACKGAFVDAGAMYLIGDDSKSGCLTLGRYNFMSLSWTWKALQPGQANRPALTVKDGIAFFLNGNRCYQSPVPEDGGQDSSTRILSDLRILTADKQVKSFLVCQRGFLYVFCGATFFKVSLEREQYMENLGWNLSNILDLKHRAVCAGDEGVFVSATTEKNEEDLRVVQYDFKTDKYPTVGYIPSHGVITGANRLYILRRKE